MGWIKELALRVHALFAQRRIAREIDDELRFHIEMRTRDNLAAGMAPDQAERAARRSFGNLTSVREESHAIRGGGALERAVWDLRRSARALARRPGFTLAATVTLALGIAATTVVFSAESAVLLRPLPYADPDRLVAVWEPIAGSPEARAASAGDFTDWRAQRESFAGVAASFQWSFSLTGAEVAERLSGQLVIGDLFGVLGVLPELGRPLGAADEAPDAPAVAVIADRLWRRRFAADPDIAGKQITLNGSRATIVGVMPPGFDYPDADTELWLPAGFKPEQLRDRRGRFVRVVARLAPGVALETARARLAALAESLRRDYPETNRETDVAIAGLGDDLVGTVRPALLALGGAVGFVLLLACANAAGLLLARAAARRRELAVRVALGASRARLMGHLLGEVAILAALAGALGIALAAWGVDALVAWNPGGIPRLAEARLDGRALLFALAASAAAALLFGLAPALVASRAAPEQALRSVTTGGRGRSRLRDALVVAQIALALVLLVGAALLGRSFLRLRAVDPGFQPDGLFTFNVDLPPATYPDNPRQVAFFRELTARLALLPGASAAGAIQDLPIRGNRMGYQVTVEELARSPADAPLDAAYRLVTPGYFDAMGVPLTEGRLFGAGDDERAPPVMLVNESFAHRAFPGASAIGRRVRFDGDDTPWRTIVGVVGDVKHMGLARDEGPAIYQPHAQKPIYVHRMTLIVRSASDPAQLVRAARAAVSAIDPALAVYDDTTMTALLARSVASPRFYAALFAVFALVALVLAAIGVYGVIAYLVAQRTKEIGIRMALGARRADILWLVVGRGLALALGGVTAGLAGSLATSRALAGLLFGVGPFDVATYAAAALLLVGVAVLACALPARRALGADPLVALREET